MSERFPVKKGGHRKKHPHSEKYPQSFLNYLKGNKRDKANGGGEEAKMSKKTKKK
jgi:hypothetical protein